MQQLDLFREIIVDNFAGGGGASTGIEMATGLSVDIAINHDPAAIAMHKANHPDTEHYCESVWDVDPKEACRGRRVGLAWFSPDCTHHSKAKGGKPVKQEIRGLAWIAVKWAIAVKPRVIMLENVEEFKDWCPLDSKGKPRKELKGVTFNSFVKALESLGYEVQFKELQACDYGAPTIRKRFFMIARCDGKKIIWPEPTHGDPQSPAVQLGRKKPWRTSSEIIDWSIGVPSIFDRRKPLVSNTLKRIQRGLERFVIEDENPFLVPDEHKAAFLISYYTEQSSKEVRGLSLKTPLHTITAGGNRFGLVTAFLTKYYGQGVGQGLKEPLHTITTRDRFGLVAVKSNGYAISDIGLRMLQPHELFAGQGFPTNYIHQIGTKSDQIRRVGNSVPPDFPDALVRANLPEMCIAKNRYKVSRRDIS
ncbi:DNA cytosine methyltransferase [Bacillus infantis]|uniref:DNA (cytosine-5-)-methyltransferase n=1 Tax=Bacillus infantis TaxID=324767 RepID=A0A5D4RK34_9BACI|nr:DNA cytosine methyltransferase [Bacillus infantis]TYS50108.1 DNA cytosine methyltransferase [Bacillus infantis]